MSNIIAIDPSSKRVAIVDKDKTGFSQYWFEPRAKDKKETSSAYRDYVRKELIEWLDKKEISAWFKDAVLIERTTFAQSSSQVGMREMLLGVLETYFRQHTNNIILLPNGPKYGWFTDLYGMEIVGREARKSKVMKEFPDSKNDDIADCKGMIASFEHMKTEYIHAKFEYNWVDNVTKEELKKHKQIINKYKDRYEI